MRPPSSQAPRWSGCWSCPPVSRRGFMTRCAIRPWRRGNGCGPFLVLASAGLFGVARRCALQVAAAIEMVHTYSLVHDDLPAMDNSDLRRGRATCHKQFDEATAVLAGDGLLTAAFGVLAHPGHSRRSCSAVRTRVRTRCRRRCGRYGRRSDDRSDRRAPELGHRRDHPTATNEDRRVDRLLVRVRSDSR